MLNATADRAPRSTLTFVGGSHAVISNVRMKHYGICHACRRSAALWTDNGLVLVGLNIRSGGHTCRWYVELHATESPIPGPACPACGDPGSPHRLTRWWGPTRTSSPLTPAGFSISASGDALEREHEVYQRLRETHAEESERADRADLRHHQRFPAPKPNL